MSTTAKPAVQPAHQPGVINVTFSSNGRGSFVDINPQSFTKVDDHTIEVNWWLAGKESTNPDYAVEFGNIVPCQHQALPYDWTLTSEPGLEDGLIVAWKWKLERGPSGPPPENLSGSIAYEIFFCYQLRADPSEHRKIFSARSMLDVDPSLILPPKEIPPVVPPNGVTG